MYFLPETSCKYFNVIILFSAFYVLWHNVQAKQQGQKEKVISLEP